MELNRYTFRLLPVILTLLLAASCLFKRLGMTIFGDDDEASTLGLIALLLLAIAVLGLLLLFSLLAVLPISKNHRNFENVVRHLLLNIVISTAGYFAYRAMDNTTKAPKRYQELFLKELLERNADTEYGRATGLKDIKSREEFREKHPLTDFETYRSYIERLKKGEQGLLTKDPIFRFHTTSGTTGSPKMLPSTRYKFNRIMWRFLLPMMFTSKKLSGESLLAPLKSNVLILVPNWWYTEAGHPIGPKSAVTPDQITPGFCLPGVMPFEAMHHFSEHAQLYIRWLFALYDRDIERTESTFAGAVIGAVLVLEENWRSLVDDIRHGKINHAVGIPADIVDKLVLKRLIWADPKRADELEREFSRGFDGIFPRLWPRMRVCCATVTGPHKIYRQRLQKLCGTVKIYTGVLMASEGGIGLNLDGGCKVTDDNSDGNNDQLFTLNPYNLFMEFIDEDDIKNQNPKTFFMDELQVGKRYELVISSMIGVYRYRLGDILEVVRFRHGKTPVIRYCARVGSILDIVGEKTTEDVIYNALKKASGTWKGCLGLHDFTTTLSAAWSKWETKSNKASIDNISEQEMCYVLFVEAEGMDRQLTSDEIQRVENEIIAINWLYKFYRDRKAFTSPKIYILKQGTFQKMKEETLIRNKAVSNQYKTPRYVTADIHLSLIASAVIG